MFLWPLLSYLYLTSTTLIQQSMLKWDSEDTTSWQSSLVALSSLTTWQVRDKSTIHGTVEGTWSHSQQWLPQIMTLLTTLLERLTIMNIEKPNKLRIERRVPGTECSSHLQLTIISKRTPMLDIILKIFMIQEQAIITPQQIDSEITIKTELFRSYILSQRR